jgi:hypothetical protein
VSLTCHYRSYPQAKSNIYSNVKTMLDCMTGYDAESFEQQAIAGDWHAAVSVLSRASLKPEVLQQLMVDDAHDEVRIALAMRADVTPAQLEWVSQCDNTFILNRLVSHPRTPTSTIRDIRTKALERDGETWRMLAEYASRTLERIARDSGVHGAF